jgi:hypothetical protein
VAPARRPATVRRLGRPVSTTKQLLLHEVVVVWVGGFAGRQLPQAQTEPLTPGLATDTST